MSLENPFQENNNIVNKPSSLLSTSTILSVIGSVIAMISAVTAYVNAEANYEKIQKMVNDKDVAKAPEFVKSFFNENALLMTQKAVESKVPILIISLIAAALCLFGALLMRKLKKDGLKLWMTGEILPILSNLLFLGFASMSGLALINLLFPAVFISIYMVCRKELVN
jgi:hypothetical protein